MTNITSVFYLQYVKSHMMDRLGLSPFFSAAGCKSVPIRQMMLLDILAQIFLIIFCLQKLLRWLPEYNLLFYGYQCRREGGGRNPAQIPGPGSPGKSLGPDYVSHVFAFLVSITTCRMCTD